MNLILDYREKDLYNECIKHNDKNINIETRNLLLGDIVIEYENKEIFIFERKTWTDLGSSIKDGRYSEQSFRLNNHFLHNHNIMYIVEGDFEKYINNKHSRTPMDTLLSSIVSINFFKGHSVYRTLSLHETAYFVLHYTYKLNKEYPKKQPYYDNIALTPIIDSRSADAEYCDTLKNTKKNNITMDNINIIFLSQIPHVSTISAKAIMLKYPTIKQLIDSIYEDDKCLDDIYIESDKGKRKISKTCRENVIKYLAQ